MSSVIVRGDTSGQVALTAPAVAGTVAVTLPSASGTMATTADITSAFSGSNQSLTTNGYQKLPSGLIMQWGVTPSIPLDNSYAVTFPIAFPTACVSVQVTGQLGATTGGGAYSIGTGTYTTTGVTIYNDENAQTVAWFAVGY